MLKKFAARVPFFQRSRDFVDVEGMLGNKNGIRSAGHAAVKSVIQLYCVSSHHFHDNRAIVRLR